VRRRVLLLLLLLLARRPLLVEEPPGHGVAELERGQRPTELGDLAVREAEAEVEAALELLQVVLREASRPDHPAAGAGGRLDHHEAATPARLPRQPAACGGGGVTVRGGARELRLRGEVGGGGDRRHFLCSVRLGCECVMAPQVPRSGSPSGLFINRTRISR